MRKITFLSLMALLAISCNNNEPKVSIIKGELANYSDTIVRIMSKGLTDTVFIKSDGTFEYETQLLNPVFLTVRIGRPTLNLFLLPGETLIVKHDFSNAIDKVVFEGELGEANRQVASTNKSLRSAFPDFRAFYALPFEMFSAKLDSVKGLAIQSLDSLVGHHKVYKALEKQRIDYAVKGMMLDYPMYNSNFTGIELNPDSIDFSFMNDFNFNLNENLSVPEYASVVSKYVNTLHWINFQKTKDNGKSNFEKRVILFELIDSIVTNIEIRDYIKHQSVMETIQFEALEDAKNSTELFLSQAKTQPYVNLIKNALNYRMILSPGKPAPSFSLTGIDGTTYQLSDFAGKLVYVDFWATWCRPCREQLPHFAKLKEIYAGKPVAFIAISVDDDRDAWVKMVTEQGMKGIQLHADRAWSSDVVKKYQVRAIPTFVLIDENGKIVEYPATRPSNPDINLIIDKLLKNIK
jgi:thiol-disulfide isomerase/thioredoxin